MGETQQHSPGRIGQETTLRAAIRSLAISQMLGAACKIGLFDAFGARTASGSRTWPTGWVATGAPSAVSCGRSPPSASSPSTQGTVGIAPVRWTPMTLLREVFAYAQNPFPVFT